MAKRSPLERPRMLRAGSCALAAGSLAAILLAGCKPVGPNYNRPGYNAPTAYKEAGASAVVLPPPNPQGGAWQPANPSDGMLKGKWWQVYQDPQLNQLEERIESNNVQLRQAMGILPGRRGPGAGGAGNPLPHAFGRAVDQPQPCVCKSTVSDARRNNNVRRLCDCRRGKLGAGLLGSHPPHSGTGARERAGERRR